MPENITAPEKKKRIFSAIQPSGTITIGNYFGALRNWVKLQDDYECIFAVADLHAITVRQDPAELRRRTYEVLSLYMACGLDPEQNILYVQSHVPAHAQLAWVLDCYTMFGELSRMTQFKDKSQKNADNINAGLFTYPVLMAADILLYQTDLVPIGDDQKQHLELTRDIANRFNTVYGPTFTVPEPVIRRTGARIQSLAEPEKKMSKSDPNENAVVRILDDKDTIIRKFKRAVTDSDTVVRRADDKPGISNLMTIYSCVTGKGDGEIEAEFAGKGYGDFKLAVGEAVAAELAPIQERYKQYLSDKAYLEMIMKQNSEKAAYLARKTLSKVYRKVGFTSV